MTPRSASATATADRRRSSPPRLSPNVNDALEASARAREAIMNESFSDAPHDELGPGTSVRGGHYKRSTGGEVHRPTDTVLSSDKSTCMRSANPFTCDLCERKFPYLYQYSPARCLTCATMEKYVSRFVSNALTSSVPKASPPARESGSEGESRGETSDDSDPFFDDPDSCYGSSLEDDPCYTSLLQEKQALCISPEPPGPAFNLKLDRVKARLREVELEHKKTPPQWARRPRSNTVRPDTTGDPASETVRSDPDLSVFDFDFDALETSPGPGPSHPRARGGPDGSDRDGCKPCSTCGDPVPRRRYRTQRHPLCWGCGVSESDSEGALPSEFQYAYGSEQSADDDAPLGDPGDPFAFDGDFAEQYRGAADLGDFLDF